MIGSGANVTAEELIRASDPVLRLLEEETGETALIVRRIGLGVVCLHEVSSRQPLRVSFGSGASLPLQTGAFGKAVLAFAPPDVQDEVLASNPPATGSDEERLRADLAEIVRSGVARSVGEVFSGRTGSSPRSASPGRKGAAALHGGRGSRSCCRVQRARLCMR
jgi:DNA-binding IclR family transcriptional regulator